MNDACNELPQDNFGIAQLRGEEQLERAAFLFLGDGAGQVHWGEDHDGQVLDEEKRERESLRDGGEIVGPPVALGGGTLENQRQAGQQGEDVGAAQEGAAAAAGEADDVVVEVRSEQAPTAVSKDDDLQRDECRQREDTGEPAPLAQADGQRDEDQERQQRNDRAFGRGPVFKPVPEKTGSLRARRRHVYTLWWLACCGNGGRGGRGRNTHVGRHDPSDAPRRAWPGGLQPSEPRAHATELRPLSGCEASRYGL